MADSRAPVLRCRRLTVPAAPARSWTRGWRRAAEPPLVDRLDLVVRSGERVWLVGDLDPGLAALVGVLRGERPAEGGLRIAGTELVGARRRARARALAQVEVWEGDPGVGSLSRTAREAVAAAAAATGDDAGEAHAVRLLIEAGLPDEEQRQPLAELSGDSLWRVRLALTAARAPVLLIVVGQLPEPAALAGVDALLERLRARGSAVVSLSETLPSTLAADERVEVLCGGRVVEVLSAGELDAPLHPYTRALAQAASAATRPSGPWAGGGCPLQLACAQAQECCAVMPRLVVPLGGRHPVACHFPAPLATLAEPGVWSEPTAREFAQGW